MSEDVEIHIDKVTCSECADPLNYEVIPEGHGAISFYIDPCDSCRMAAYEEGQTEPQED